MKFVAAVAFLVMHSLFADIQFTHRTDGYATHQPVLYEMAMRTTGPIIEFGCGNGSTDLLHEVCKQTGRILVTVDDDLNWLMRFAEKYRGDGYEEDNSGWHKFFYVAGKYDHADPRHWVDFLESSALLKTMNFDVCFVDQSPWLGRYETIKWFKGRTKYIIVHDCDYYPTNCVFGKIVGHTGRHPILDFGDLFRHSKVYYPLEPWVCDTGPPTLLGSDFEVDLPEIDFSNY
jgi:hypothetical protein